MFQFYQLVPGDKFVLPEDIEDAKERNKVSIIIYMKMNRCTAVSLSNASKIQLMNTHVVFRLVQ